jgi:mRNA interferase MazF
VIDPPAALAPGEVVWVTPDPAIGREQAGRRPALVIAGNDYLATVDTLAIVVPITTVDRHWPNHVPIVGADLPQPSWAMSEQVRTISRDRVLARAGSADHATLRNVRDWVRDFLDL